MSSGAAVSPQPGRNQQWRKALRLLLPFTGLRLLLPAIVPSWRFFDAVTASPRLDYAVLATPDDTPEETGGRWQEFRPRPARLPPGMMLRRLFWNPQWNESLFLVSLAERLMSASATAETEAHSQREMLARVARHLHRHGICDRHAYLRIRLRFVRRAGAAEQVDSQIAYISSPFPIAELLTR